MQCSARFGFTLSLCIQVINRYSKCFKNKIEWTLTLFFYQKLQIWFICTSMNNWNKSKCNPHRKIMTWNNALTRGAGFNFKPNLGGPAHPKLLTSQQGDDAGPKCKWENEPYSYWQGYFRSTWQLQLSMLGPAELHCMICYGPTSPGEASQ